MKNPSKIKKDLPTTSSNLGSDLSQYISAKTGNHSDFMRSTLELSSSAFNYLTETERTEQVKAEALRDMHISDNQLEQARLHLAQRQAELNVEYLRLENERATSDESHKRKLNDQVTNEQTIEALRERLRQGIATEQDYLTLRLLHSISDN
ncbi:hypothetical protein [Vibrio nereis]|uniref:hypothetical protein n=1 Tax=Vibrio nereis TaxID=693 RepID=UPI00249412AA|nr:hypothetical protein [Vibrio nereis]